MVPGQPVRIKARGNNEQTVDPEGQIMPGLRLFGQ
jgi:hypothetical protein